ncbi:MAG: hypothetical protein C5B49_13585 [Bdellovibrio sp.]|nr:MAG: hypothetical protein C5B49_13585 [Bdellovibrio sp.]
MEESGMIDLAVGLDNERTLINETLRFLSEIKNQLTEAASTFNELKTSPLGRIKIYGIAKTQADFMLFRNGFKMIFSMKEPGVISIRFNFMGPNFLPTAVPSIQNTNTPLTEEHLIQARKGPFHEIVWTFQEQPIQVASVVRYHLTLFIKESSK